MEGAAVDKIKELAIQGMELKEVDGYTYSPVKLERVYSDPRPDSVRVLSLTGIIDYFESNIDNLKKEKLIIHVVDHANVEVITAVHGEANKRHTIINAQLDNIEWFPFNKFIEQEMFIIKCRSMFCKTEDLDRIIRYTSKIDTESTIKTKDDGVTQIARIKQGASGVLADGEELPVTVKLKPFRTFSEVEQPESEFLFRMKSGENVGCALFEADGGAWRNKARENIAKYLQDTGIPVIT